jgi:hypothetical protein
MRVEQLDWAGTAGWQQQRAECKADDVNTVLYFGERSALASGAFRSLNSLYPRAAILGCSTGGQIIGCRIVETGATAAALSFRATRTHLARRQIETRQMPASAASRELGKSLGDELQAGDLAGIFVLSDGLRVNGSALVAGLVDAVGPTIPISGGLASDGAGFSLTLVGADGEPAEGCVGGLGFYGNAIRFATGTGGGWEAFGPRRKITCSDGNRLLTLDNQPALALYERYLGDEACALPSSGLLYPLRIYDPDRPTNTIVRTLLGIDRDAKALVFAGDVPQGWRAQLMRGSIDRLREGAFFAAQRARHNLGEGSVGDTLALMVSCIGRRLLMGQRTIEEVEATNEALPLCAARLGFFSYGEIAPDNESGHCNLHNQTMTVTLLAETDA